MGRTFSTDSIILRKYRIGETHKAVVLLSEGRGMLSAIAHGALRPGGRLASGTEPLTLARLHLYHDPVKDSYKVTDCVVLSSFEGVKADVVRYFVASLWSEVVLRSLGGGMTDASLYTLLKGSLAELDAASQAGVDLADLQFLWRFLGLAGYRPDLDTCASCGTRVADEEPVFHPAGGRGLVCGACADRLGGPLLEMGPAARRYLSHSLTLSPLQATRVILARPAARALRRLSAELVESILELRLRTLEAGAGIL